MSAGSNALRVANPQGPRLAHFGALLVLGLVVLLSLYPFVMMVLNSFKTDSEILANPAALPQSWTLSSYLSLFQHHGGAWINFLNGLIVATTSTGAGGLDNQHGCLCLHQVQFCRPGRDFCAADADPDGAFADHHSAALSDVCQVGHAQHPGGADHPDGHQAYLACSWCANT
jgi:hypothetical protein